ncbi:YheC/YheD family protein [Metabacillus arenae]|uniref:YheC/YheD family protein n=1 Tax=Metabacillus arenae TaxID=2771434 RepID=A0A926NIE3_9BACI|nr:YheC/YheD family protein [Metabacillus arenae]MBD1381911.1 YheC/YheD family protein [Metabacillus arenae]
MGKNQRKWKHYEFLKEERALLKHLPETKRLKKQSFWELMDKYHQVIVKPCAGRLGVGVTQVSVIDKNLYEIHSENKKTIITSKAEVYNHFKDIKKCCIVQQKIPLATIKGCPFDVRVVIRRGRNSSKWGITKRFAKLAANGFIITNAAQKILPVEEAIRKSSLNHPLLSAKDLVSKIDEVVHLATKQLEPFYPERRSIGFDIGLDQKGGAWFIEANIKSKDRNAGY